MNAACAAISRIGIDTRIVSIDPLPRIDIDRLRTKVIRAPVEATDRSRIASLEREACCSSTPRTGPS
jgi:hypothetical protein